MSKGSDMRNPTKHTSGTENQIEAERSAIDKELQKFVTSLLKEVNSDVFPEFKHIWQKKLDLMVILVKKTEESVPEHAAYERRSKKKADECVPEQAAHERRSKKKVDHVLNVDDLTYDEEPLTNIMTPSIAKKLQRRKGKVMVFEDSPSKEIKRKSGGMKSTPSRSSVGKSLVGPTRSWSKVVTPTRKRKVVSSSDSEMSSTATKIKLEKLMKAFIEEKEAEHGGDDNGGADVEDSIGGNDVETNEDKEAKGEEYVDANSDSQEDI
ncbi:hypothetical protein KIW84_074320 [Lathyrus oleraceus]|uniref:Uncharacterized protein n=1 Tax=Pisum sativum TaxID=3888 RepID=A0A9D4VQZ2_PEA|nr:hypothetical protein KIW84_074320 [Pisum sativum]